MKCYCTFSLDNILPKLSSNVLHVCIMQGQTILYYSAGMTRNVYSVSTQGFHTAFKSTKSIFYQTLMKLLQLLVQVHIGRYRKPKFENCICCRFYFVLILLKKGVYKAHFRHSCKSFLYILLDYSVSAYMFFSILLHKQDFALQ